MSFDAPVLRAYRVRPDQAGRWGRVLAEDASLARELEGLPETVRRIRGDVSAGTLEAELVADPEDGSEYVRVTFTVRGPEEDVGLLEGLDLGSWLRLLRLDYRDVGLLEGLDRVMPGTGAGRVAVQPVYGRG